MDAKDRTVLAGYWLRTTMRLSLLAIFLVIQGALCAQDVGARTRDAMEARAEEHYLRAIDHYLADRYDSAVHHFQASVDLREELFADTPTLELGKANHLLGSSLRLRGDFFAAEPPLKRAIAVFQAMDTVPEFRVVRSRTELIDVWIARGEFSPAQRMAELVYRQAQRSGDVENVLSGLLRLGNLYLQMDDFSTSMAYSSELMRYVRELLPGANKEDREYYELDSYLAYAQLQLARALTDTDSLARAATLYRSAIPTLRAAGDALNLQIAHNNLADNCLLGGQLPAAKAALERARELQQYSANRRNLAVTEDHLGEYYLKKGEPAAALRAFQRAQAALIDGYAPDAPGDVPPDAALRYSPFQTDLFIYLGDQARALQALIEAGKDFSLPQLAVYRASDRLIDFIREQHGSTTTKLFWRKRVLPVYEAAIRRCHEDGRAAEAYLFFEKSKAVLLYESLAGNEALRRLPDSLRQRDDFLSRSVSQLADDTLAYLAAREELNAFRQQLADTYPAYRRANRAPETYSMDDLWTDHLRFHKKHLVHYLCGPERTYAFTLGEAGPATFDLGPSDSLAQVAEDMLRYFSRATEIQNDPAGYARAAHATYLAFVQPLHLPPGPLLVIPDGPLTYLPFPAMITEPPAEARMGQLPYFLNRHPVSFTHSASLLNRRLSFPDRGFKLTAFAPFTDGTATPDYPVLPFEQDELRQVQRQYQTELFRDAEASLDRFVRQAPQAGVLHLSTHAFSTTDAESPHIAFHDSLLLLRDLYHQDVGAEMVVLSACQTNIGQLASGEGVLGLGRGFLRAGAGSVVASLWNVNAFGSGRILTEFYARLGQGESRGQALHQAQLSYLTDASIKQRNKSPYFWAGFNYYGPDRALPLRTSPGRAGWLAWVLIGLVGFVLLGWGLKRWGKMF